MMRFAFYGRVSTEDQQDPAASRGWQISRASQLIAPHGGVIVEEYFDIGMSRSLPWKRRPQGLRLLDALPDPNRGFDAIVIGEPQRAFFGNQFGLTFPVMAHYGVQLWVPEVGGQVEPDSEAHDMIMTLYGGMGKGERNRVMVRVKAAMSDMARNSDRFLGGRPPYGYMLADVGPHPNPVKAGLGQRAHKLVPDPVTAPVVQRIFELFVVKRLGLRAIAQILTDEGVPSPSQHDPARNSHRDPRGWSHPTIRAILVNPNYSGRRVWGKQEKFEQLFDPMDVAAGNVTKMRWRDSAEWIEATEQTHEGLVDPDTLLSVKAIMEGASLRAATPRKRATPNVYSLRGMIECACCGRKMQGATRTNKSGSVRTMYRCELGKSRSFPVELQESHPRTVYVREDLVLPKLDAWIATLADATSLARVATADDKTGSRVAQIRTQLSDVEGKIAKLIAAIEAGTDPAFLQAQITARSAEKSALLAELSKLSVPKTAVSAEAIQEQIDFLGGIAAVLKLASAEQRQKLYESIALRLQYDPRRDKATVSVDLTACRTWKCPRGDLNPHTR